MIFSALFVFSSVILFSILGLSVYALYIRSMEKQSMKYDVVIAGGGPAGLALAKSLADLDLTIAVVEPAPLEKLVAPDYDGRETALTHLSYKILRKLGVMDHVAEDQVSFIKKAHVVNGESPYALKFDHEEAGEETLGYMVSNQNIRRASYAALQGVDAVEIMNDCKVTALEADDFGARVTLDSGAVLEAKLVVGADGRFSQTRKMMDISTEINDLKRTCIVGVMKHSEAHHDTAYECFHYDRTLAVLPLNNGLVSVVITLPSDEAEDVLAMPAAEFELDIAERFGHRVGDMTISGKLHAYPLACTYAKAFYGPRFALLGDAAVGMHPVTAHGYNLGLRGAHSLAAEIALMVETGGDIGSPVALKAYNRKHQIVCKPLYWGTNGIVSLFTNTRPAAKAVRSGLLYLGNILKPANKLIMNQLTESKG